jgi:hypothetical protein
VFFCLQGLTDTKKALRQYTEGLSENIHAITLLLIAQMRQNGLRHRGSTATTNCTTIERVNHFSVCVMAMTSYNQKPCHKLKKTGNTIQCGNFSLK